MSTVRTAGRAAATAKAPDAAALAVVVVVVGATTVGAVTAETVMVADTPAAVSFVWMFEVSAVAAPAEPIVDDTVLAETDEEKGTVMV